MSMKVDLFYENGLLVETFRQWTVIVLCSFFICLYAGTIRRLYKTHRAFNFDCAVIAMEAVKVSILVCVTYKPAIAFSNPFVRIPGRAHSPSSSSCHDPDQLKGCCLCQLFEKNPQDF